MAGATIEFHFPDVSAEERFLAEYLASAWERFLSSEYWSHGWFWRYGQFAEYESGPDGGLVRLVFDGDAGVLVERERDHWERFAGLDSWELRRYDDAEAGAETYESLLAQQQDAKGTVGGEREYRFKSLTARLAAAYYAEFDDPLPAVPDPDTERDDPTDPLGVGAWALCHDLLVQLGYDWYDETEIALQMLRSRLQSVAAYRGADAAREEYDRIRAALDAHEGELDEWLAENETGTRSEP